MGAQDRPHIRKRKPPAIAEVPIGSVKTGKFGAQIQLRMWQLAYKLVKLEGVAMKRKLRGDIEPERLIPPCGNLHLLPLQAPHIRSRARLRIKFQQELEILALHRKRDVPVVDHGTAITKHNPANLQLKQSLVPGTIARMNPGRWQIAVAVLIEFQRNLRPPQSARQARTSGPALKSRGFSRQSGPHGTAAACLRLPVREASDHQFPRAIARCADEIHPSPRARRSFAPIAGSRCVVADAQSLPFR